MFKWWHTFFNHFSFINRNHSRWFFLAAITLRAAAAKHDEDLTHNVFSHDLLYNRALMWNSIQSAFVHVIGEHVLRAQ